MTEDIDTFTVRLAARLDEIAAIEPSSAAVARVRAALLAPAHDERRTVIGRWPNLWGRPAMALAFAVGLLAIGTTSVFAAPGALPDSPLYAVRNFKETLQVRLASSPAERATLYASFATERSAQLRALTRNNAAEPNVVQTLLRDIKDRIHEANQEANGDGQDARAAVQQAEGQIGSQLNQIQQEGNLPAGQDNSLTDTLNAVQSGQPGPSGQSGDASGNDNTNQP
jgi:hypothetical protein